MDIKSNSLGTQVNRQEGVKSKERVKEAVVKEEDPEVKAKNADYKVSVSKEASEKKKLMEQILEVVKSTPDVREEKVNKIKEMIKKGQYELDAGKIADGILREAVREKLATDSTKMME